MIRSVCISEGVVGGVEKELIESILPQLKGSFIQRKEFFEYYYQEREVELSIQDIDNISQEFIIKLSWDELEIVV